MKLVIYPLFAALVGLPSLSHSLPAAEDAAPPQAEGDDNSSAKPGDDQKQRPETKRQRDETKRRNETGKPSTTGKLDATSTDGQGRTAETTPTNDDNRPENQDDHTTSIGTTETEKVRVQERASRLKTERPELFKRLDVNGNGELSPEELRRSRELYGQRQPAGSGKVGDPAQAKGMARQMPVATANEEVVADYLLSE
jgi:hypothetical protein